MALFVCFFILGCFFSLVQAVDLPNIQDSSAYQQADQTKQFIEEQKWEYLSSQWKSILLNNTALANVDSFLKKMDPVIFTLFGEHYTLSLTLVFVVLLWIMFYVVVSTIFANFSTFNKGICWMLGLLLSIILAHVQVFHSISIILFKVFFFREGVWTWIGFAVFFIAYILILATLKRFITSIGKAKKKEEYEERAMLQSIQQKSLKDFTKEIDKGFKQ